MFQARSRPLIQTTLSTALAALIAACGGSQGHTEAASSTTQDTTTSTPTTAPQAADFERVQPKIVGGSQATEPYPFTAALLSAQNQQFCGGTLIAPQWVVTAAHCLDGPLSQVRVGSPKSESEGQVVRVAQRIQHPDYDAGRGGNDIALLQLAEPVASHIAPAPIASSTPSINTPVRLLGWGQTTPAPKDNTLSPTLKELDTQVIASTDCPGWATGDLCMAETTGQASCYGDSGGPALIQSNGTWQLTGAASRGSRICGEGNSIYTDVTAFRGWIEQHVHGNAPPPPSSTDNNTPPCTDCATYTGELAGPGLAHVHPRTGHYRSQAGQHQAWLSGPANATYDLILFRWSARHGNWSPVAQASSHNGSTAHLSHMGREGAYALVVLSRSGSGAYKAYLSAP